MASIYFDCNATTPMAPAASAAVREYMDREFGNSGSRTHDWGQRAKSAVREARAAIAKSLSVRSDEVIFTSGATESDNLAILGLREHGESVGKRHIITTAVEHKAVLESVARLQLGGWSVTVVMPDSSGCIDAADVAAALRPDTLLVSVMHANNETGAIQPIEAVAACLGKRDVYFHVDAAQTFGKLQYPLRNPRIDLMSISAHKVHGPKGIGALIVRRRNYRLPPLAPLLYGGGQERGLRPGTLPVPLVVGFGVAVELSMAEAEERAAACSRMRAKVMTLVDSVGGMINGDPDRCLCHTVNFSLPGVDSEEAMVALNGLLAVSNGSACTSATYQPSHVLAAMRLPKDRIAGALRLSWCHMTTEPDWAAVRDRLAALR